MQTSPAVEQIKTVNGPRVRGISPEKCAKLSIIQLYCADCVEM